MDSALRITAGSYTLFDRAESWLKLSTGDLLLRGTAKRKIHRKITQNAGCHTAVAGKEGFLAMNFLRAARAAAQEKALGLLSAPRQQPAASNNLYPARAEAPAGGSSPGPLGHSEAHAVSRLLVGGATRRMPNLLVTLRPLAGGSVAQRQLASADIACSHGISSAVLLQATAATNLEVKGMPHGI
jgi:hypothetical protein